MNERTMLIRNLLRSGHDYETITRIAKCTKARVSQVKGEMLGRQSYLRQNRSTVPPKEPQAPVVPCRTAIGPWFIDEHGNRSRVIEGVAA
jgi:hypothetical protein